SSTLSPVDESLASFVRRRYGAELLERLAQPLAGGIYGADPEELSLSATMPRFLQLERLYGSVTRGLRRTSRQPGQQASGARYGLFISFRQGIAALPERLAQLLGDRVRLSTPVERIEKKAGGGYRVHTAGAVSWDAGAVLLAMPASKAAGLLQDSFPEISNSLKHIEYGSAATVSFGFSRSDVPHPLDAYGFVVPSVERRVVLASTWASAKWPGRAPLGKVLIRVFLGGADYPDIDDWDESTLILAARRGLRDLMGVVADPELVRVDRYVRSMPRYCTGHQARVAQIMGSLGLRDSGDPGDPSSSLGPQETLHLTERFEKNAPTTGLFLAGNAYSGVGIPNSIASGERAAELALQELCRIESSRALLNA
ncbi:MAG: protoporphyrinogen oxidase, partial [Myxococcota bacterium]